MNTGASWPSLAEAEARVLGLQSKLHRWATADSGRSFDDLFNLVCDPAFLRVAWERVRGNKGAGTAGVDGVSARSITDVEEFLSGLRADLKARRFIPTPVRERMIPKAGGKLRRLGIPTVTDRVVQASLKLVLEPVFEADFKPCSYGFRPRRRAQDAIAEIHFLASRSYEWVLEGDIEACFDEIDHTALMGRVRQRIRDKRILNLVKKFLRAGILSEDGVNRETYTGTPQGGILSPLLANIALSVLDEHFTAKWEASGTYWQRASARKRGGATCRIVRYADDFVVMVSGKREHAEALKAEVSNVLAAVGLRLSEAKTSVAHIDEGFDFLGFRIQRRHKKGEKGKRAVYTYPSKKALASAMDKVRTLTRREQHRTLADLLRRLNPVLRGWCNYFRHGVSKRVFGYLDHFAFWRVVTWIRKRHVGLSWGTVRHRFLANWEIRDGNTELFRARAVTVDRYRYRAARIPTPWAKDPELSHAAA